MAIHTTTGAATTLADGYVYLTDATTSEVTSTQIPTGKTVVKIEGTSWDYQYLNEVVKIAMPVFKWTTKDIQQWITDLKRINQTIEVRGTIASDSVTDTAFIKYNNMRYLIGSLLPYEANFASSDRRGGTFTVVKNRVLPYPGGTSTVQTKFEVICVKASIKELGARLDKFEVMLQLLEGQKKLLG